ncbi:membrane hypothetical protein [Roseovarius sp. EC-HK134]|uniref:hypothetical protein n=1 Tax=unclassified Roseovarius TaxID=2614913 RepID=UPI001250F99F|nr:MULTISPECIES: hypothetical protein [unclassified Roseovarius]VVT15372.1 membrane hypothetical protein [Roseovarius sp. EC-HK134]VVT15881.1 membrane hypothetical protein [Roseovarius sp. EC-SD190]
MFEGFQKKLDVKENLYKCIQAFGYIRLLFLSASIFLAYNMGFISRIDPGLVSLFEANEISGITFQLFLHISIAGLFFYTAPLAFGFLGILTSLIFAKYQCIKRKKRFPKNYRIKKLEIAYQQLFLKKLRAQRFLMFTLRLVISLWIFFKIHIGGGIILMLGTILIVITISFVVLTVESFNERPTAFNLFSAAAVSLLMVFYMLGISRYSHLASTACVTLLVDSRWIEGSIVLSSSTKYFVVEKGMEKVSVFPSSQVLVATGNSFHYPRNNQDEFAFNPTRLPFTRSTCQTR